MIAYTQKNNDVYVFFENDKLEDKIVGSYFNEDSSIGIIEVSVVPNLNDLVKAGKENGIYKMELSEKVYSDFCKRKTFELHEGFRHIFLRDTSNMESWSFWDKFNYGQLRNVKTKL